VTNPDAIVWTSVAIVSLGLASVGALVANVRARTSLVLVKAVGTVLLLAACYMSPVLVGALVDKLNATEGVGRVYIDIGLIAGLLPAGCALAAYAITWAGKNRALRPV
jgi:hypothetical protein